MDAIISNSRNAAEGDNSPDTQTRFFRVLTYRCRNRQCEVCGKEIGQERLEQPLS